MKIYLLLFLFLAPAISVFAQRDTIQHIGEVLIEENRFRTPVSEQNRNVYVIDQQSISKLPARSLQEVLQFANGVDIRQRGPFGTQADISVDGGSFEQTVVLLNGTKIIDQQTAHNMLNLPVPLELIDRIEVLRGPAARVYGVNSLTGAINIITKKTMDSGLFLSSYLGSNFEKNAEGNGNTFTGRGVQLGGSWAGDRQQHTLFGSHDKSNGYRFNTAFENNKLFYQGMFQPGSGHEILATAGYIRNGFGANGFYAAPGDRNSDEIVETTLASIQSRHQLSPGFSLMPRLSYRYNEDDYRYFGPANLNAGRSRHYTHALAAELNATYELSKGELGFGAEVRNDQIRSSNIGKHERQSMGVFVEYRTLRNARFNVNFGTYLNYNSDYKWQIYPGADASFRLSRSFKLTASLGTSQRLPSFTDLFLNQLPGNIGNPDLEPENAFQGELGFKFSSGSFSLQSTYFYRNISQFIDWTRTVDTQPWQSNNLGDVNTNGFNLRSMYQIEFSRSTALNIHLGYSWLDPDFRESSPGLKIKYSISSLRHQVTNTLNWQIKQTSVLLSTRFNERITGKSYWINDLRLQQGLGRVTLFADAQNIFNTTYFEVGAVPLPGRWMSLGLRFRVL